VPLIRELREALWAPQPEGAGQWRRRALYAARVVDRLVDDVNGGRLNLYAMSLVYTTLLSIVPVLAVSFSVLKGFGVHNQLEPMLLTLLAPLGDKGAEIARQVIEFVDNIKVGVLGALGLAFLIYTVVSLVQKVEAAFNYIWYTRSERSLSRRFSDYLSVLLVGPVLVFAALGITGSALSSDAVQWLAEHEPAKTLISLGTRLVPILLIVAAFTFVYKLIPFTRVQLKAAFAGALVAGVLWESAGLAFASFIAASTRYTAIYSSFAIGVLTIIWLYLAWLILLVGCRIAFYFQHPEHLWRRAADAASMAPRQMETLALRAMIEIGMRFSRGQGPTPVEGLVAATGATRPVLDRVIAGLENGGLVLPVGGEDTAFMPREPLAAISAAQILDAVRGPVWTAAPGSEMDEVVSEIALSSDLAGDDELRRQNLEQLVSRVGSPREVRQASG